MASYKNIPVDEDTYVAVKAIAVANGFGERGLGAQVKQWVVRELPECEHPKTPVQIEIYPNDEPMGGELAQRHGWYCSTCNRVYQRVIRRDTIKVTVAEPDPYGQPTQNKTKKRRQRVGRDI